MLHCPRSKGDPVAGHKGPSGWWILKCPLCEIISTRQTRDLNQALFWFWQKHDYETKETNMAQTYEQGFKEGVEAAGRKIFEELPLSGITDPVDVLNAIPHFLRKKLLTKKVTKWTGVITSEWGGKPDILGLCDSFEEANGFLLKNPKPLAGPIPIEIEVPL